MRNFNYWPLFFIGIFSFTFAMIVWTIVSTSKAVIDEDRSFLKSYQEVDDKYNEIMTSNMNFKKYYDVKILLNGKEVEFTVDDIMYSQRILEKRTKHKNLFNVGVNTLKVYAVNKNTNEKKELEIELKITKSNANDKDMILRNENFINENNQYVSSFEIDEENYWNITGTFRINDNTGYLYIKTNAS